MSTSGSYDFSVSRDDIIKDAMIEIGELEAGETPDADETTTCARRLNMMVKAWVVKGYHLWTIQEAVMFQVLSQTSYSLGAAATDAEWCSATDYAATTLSAAALSGAASVTLTSASSFTTGDRIGILLDSGALQWTTCTISGSTATLGAVLTGAAASANVVFGYTSRLVQPRRLIPNTAMRRDINGNEQPISLIAKPEYELLTDKTQSGKTIQLCYLPYLTSGTLWTWPTADLATDVIRFCYERPIQDFDATTDNPDFPVEAAEALYLGLAVRIAGVFGATDELPRIKLLADEALDEFLNWDVEQAPVKFQPYVSPASSGRRW